MTAPRGAGRSCVVAFLSCLAVGGCASCNGRPEPGDAGDADVADADAPLDADDAGEPDADADAGPDAPPGCEPLDIVDMPRTREGMDCGLGCRQVTFADGISIGRYAVGDRYLAYEGGNSRRISQFVVDLATGEERRFEFCGDLDTLELEQQCSLPGVWGDTLVYATQEYADRSGPYTLWRFSEPSPFRCALASRTMTAAGRPLMYVDLHDDLVVWYDSAVAPAGLYAMSIWGGDVISLTGNECVCYGSPHVWGRQVVYESWRDGPRNIYIVDVDTLEDRALTHSLAPQFHPAFDGRWVVWTDGRNDPSPDPYFYRVNLDIYGMELPDGPETVICDDPSVQQWPDVRWPLVVWSDFRNADDPNDAEAWARGANVDIYLFDLATGEEHQVTSSPGPEIVPRIWGRRVYYVAPDAIGQDAVFEVDLDVRLAGGS